ncbi:hypothetical protein ACS0TY_028957 [Phlomoides rotata]
MFQSLHMVSLTTSLFLLCGRVVLDFKFEVEQLKLYRTWSKFASGQIATNIKFYHSMKFLTGGISSLEIFFLFPLSITLSEKFFLSDHYRRLNVYF